MMPCAPAPGWTSSAQHSWRSPRLSDPLPVKVFLDAAEIYRRGRQKGSTIRSSTDCLIAAIAIENRTPIWHRDRDFSLIASYTSLELVRTKAGERP
jgi:predicted nucleic acid-binding protein